MSLSLKNISKGKERKMVDSELVKRMVLAPLTTETTKSDIIQFAKDIKGLEPYSVLVDEFYIQLAKELMPSRKIGTIIAYPFGGFTTEMKVELTKKAVKLGCSEFDIGIKYSYIKSGKYDLAKEDMKRVVEASEGKLDIVGMIQVGQMTLDETRKICELFLDCGLRIVKTNSGMNQGYSEVEHIHFIRRLFGDSLEIEVSGGIRTKEDAYKYIDAGVDRLHSSVWQDVVGFTGGTQ